ncbi:carbohydrate porin [Aliagarivorans taiwanensis]|uniref:carbohydrate porin n=1 Tax=Aliagarivorans taiwanensis TaxID=561966 RepID=UPI0004235901|nr:carbohydrate porin [Aliagarivorans taiwanensis]
MKLKALSIACTAALAASAFTPSAMALEGFEFHGYFRSAAFSLLDGPGDTDAGSRFEYDRGKGSLGRLGQEGDDFYELAFNKGWELEGGNKITIKTRLGQANLDNSADMNGQNIDGSSTGLIEAFVEFEGLTSTGVMWGGQRYYGRDNYNFLTDNFYTDWSGTGLGVQRLELGGGQWDFAYLSSTQSQQQGIWHNAETGEWGEYAPDLRSEDPLHMVHVRAQYGAFRVDFAGKYLASNFTDDAGEEFATNGIEAALSYNPKGFFGISESGFSTVMVQAGNGLGGGNMLGRSFTNYNAYSGWINAGGQTNMRKVDSSTSSYRVNAWGGWFGSHMVVLPWAQYEYVSNGAMNGDENNYGWNVGVRPVFTLPSVENFAIATEVAYRDYKADKSGAYKLTLAPTWSMATGTGPQPEIRVMVSYFDYEADGADSETVFGVQADMWW